MRTVSRVTVSALTLGATLLLAPTASAQEACPYPFDPADPRCVEVVDVVVDREVVPEVVTQTTRAPEPPVRAANNATTLPFTGGEVTLLGLAGVGALAGGVALVVAGRKRRAA